MGILEIRDPSDCPEVVFNPATDRLLAVRGDGLFRVDEMDFLSASAAAAAEASVLLNALVARMTVAPSTDRKRAMVRLIASLLTAGVWDRLDALWLTAAHDAQAARLNWIADRYNLTAINSPAFTVDRGYKGDGSAAYLTTGFIGGGASDKSQQDSATVGATIRQASVSGTRVIIGATDTTAPSGSGGTRLMTRYDSGGGTYVSMMAVNDSSNSAAVGGALMALGTYTITRTSAATSDWYLGATLQATRASPSLAPTTEVYLLADHFITGAANFLATEEISAAFAGGGLTATQVAGLTAALGIYHTTLGA